MTIYRDAKLLVGNISEWIVEKLQDSGKKGGIVGLSGGIDSAVVAAILKMVCGNSMLAVIMPCHSSGEDLEDAMKVVRKFKIPWLKVELTETYDTLLRAFPPKLSSGFGPHLSNLKPRLRMTTLYCIGQQNDLLVCGTGNKAELSMGYFTKFGDSGVDILPLGDLLKGEVIKVAKELGVPPGIIKKPPSAGLWPGQTDEDELGLTYVQIDRYLATGEAAPDVAERISFFNKNSAHKRAAPPICIIEPKLAERQE